MSATPPASARTSEAVAEAAPQPPSPAPAPTPAPAATPKAEPSPVAVTPKEKALPVRQYLDATVVPTLRAGLRALVKARPEDPFEYLANYLRENKPQAK